MELLTNLYFLVHGICIAFGIFRLNYHRFSPRGKTAPRYMRIQPWLEVAGWLLGPAGAVIYLVGDNLVPEKYKTHYQTN